MFLLRSLFSALSESGLGHTASDNDLPLAKRTCTLRSESTLPHAGKRQHVLPKICIICRSDKMKTNPVTRKRMYEKLVQCETKEGGLLVRAAELQKDEGLLVHIRRGDLVALEAHYHASCHRSYTRFLSKGKHLATDEKMFQASYNEFLRKVIDERILQKKEIFRMTKLTKMFIKTIKTVEGISCPRYRSHNLKRRLRNSHPQLQFLKASKRSDSELVFTRHLAVEDVVEDQA